MTRDACLRQNAPPVCAQPNNFKSNNYFWTDFPLATLGKCLGAARPEGCRRAVPAGRTTVMSVRRRRLKTAVKERSL
ncbi:hypothetical protein J6590_064203 [Homalodisca vitripennis]|nr:hypothetical protein J6590_064203 [Homalodisca vitripennis]